MPSSFQDILTTKNRKNDVPTGNKNPTEDSIDSA